jgi:uncharacterized protein YukE
MAEAYVKPEQLRAFAHLLKGYSEATGRSMAVLHAQLDRLGSTWRDREYGRFVQEMQKIEAQLAGLRAEISAMTPSLEADANAADEIHRGRL